MQKQYTQGQKQGKARLSKLKFIGNSIIPVTDILTTFPYFSMSENLNGLSNTSKILKNHLEVHPGCQTQPSKEIFELKH